MYYKINRGAMEISHILVIITLFTLAIAILAPFHFNVGRLGQTIYSLISGSSAYSGSNPSYIETSATMSSSDNIVTITITIRNNGNSSIILSGTTLIGSAKCNLSPLIIIPPQSTGELTLSIYTMDNTMSDPVTVNVGGDAYSTGTPQIFCYGTYLSLADNNGFTIVFSTVNGGNIYVNVNQ
ncbi:hypothetical protein [Vulcanisaeta sp. JCM 16159]|uniref:hypothetical protein n=1 Tax=Vulcanisaeta sp. JCM 16159 TaxID=1295371 RepID=UPI0006D057C7|nr:hypothetical protein [Vulcanisaeta sp. JCM 16159]